MGGPFATILRSAVEKTPGAIGGAFAARDGEMVEAFVATDPLEWAIFTAHYGVVFASIEAALSTWHFGGASVVVFEHHDIDVVVQAVDADYYALIAVGQPAPLQAAMDALGEAVAALRREIA
jgi:hypothetical protein